MSGFLRDMSRVIPICMTLGAGMEFFMIKTGFYDIALKKATERKDEADYDAIRRQNRMKELGINFDSDTSSSTSR